MKTKTIAIAICCAAAGGAAGSYGVFSSLSESPDAIYSTPLILDDALLEEDPEVTPEERQGMLSEFQAATKEPVSFPTTPWFDYRGVIAQHPIYEEDTNEPCSDTPIARGRVIIWPRLEDWGSDDLDLVLVDAGSEAQPAVLSKEESTIPVLLAQGSTELTITALDSNIDDTVTAAIYIGDKAVRIPPLKLFESVSIALTKKE